MDHLPLHLADLLHRQHGIFTNQQAIGVGFSDDQLHRRRTSGLIVPVAAGIHRVVSAPDTPWSRLWGAHLAAPGSSVSHRSATWVLGYCDHAPMAELSVSASQRPAPPGTIVHRRTVDMASWSVVIGGLRVTRPEVTMLEMASLMNETTYRDLIDRYAGGHSGPIEKLADWFPTVCGPGRAGTRIARRELERRLAGDVAESKMERLFLDIIDGSSIPRPVLQWVPPWNDHVRVDGAYLDAMVLVELDGKKWHGTHQRTIADQERDHISTTFGYRTIRFTWSQIRFDPKYVKRILTGALAVERAG